MERTVRRKRGIFCLSLILVCVCAFSAPRIMAADQLGPKESIQTLNATLLDAMKRADQLGYAGRYKLMEPVIKDIYAFSFMGSQSVGRYWKTLNDEQRRLFLDTYREWSIATYAGRFDGYSGERFELVSESAPVQGTVTVISKLIQSNEEPIVFSYLMRKVEDRWRVVDIQISGVSQLAMTRAQFTEIMKSKGLDGLISMLKSKTAGFTQPKK
jgi:phospholipid transport system substrate-binding protein